MPDEIIYLTDAAYCPRCGRKLYSPTNTWECKFCKIEFKITEKKRVR